MDQSLLAFPGRAAIRAALRWPSTWVLVATNLAALAGVFAGWSVPFLLAVYWAETAIIGAYTILRMYLAAPGLAAKLRCTGLALVFVLHFGTFMLGQGLLVAIVVAVIEDAERAGLSSGLVIDTFLQVLRDPWLGVSIAALALSHGVSFVTHALRRGEPERRSPSEVMKDPYRRVLLMHLAVFLGAALVALAGASLAFAVSLVLLKTLADVGAHARAHQFERAPS